MVSSTVDASRPPNLVEIILDCVRAKSLGVTGGSRIARTPTIDRLAQEGTTFSRAVAPANWTVPAVMSMETGTYPSAHGRRTFAKGPPPFETIATWLSRNGYETAVFTEQVHLIAGYGLEEGYSTQVAPTSNVNLKTEDRSASRQLFSHADFLYSERVRKLIGALPPFIIPINMVNHPSEVQYKSRVCNGQTVASFERWMGSRTSSQPFHLLFNFVNGHEPYPKTDEWGSLSLLARWYARTPKYYLLAVQHLQEIVPWREFEGGYLLAIEDADRKIAGVLAALEAAGELDRSLILVTADHGQSFGEGGNVFHGNGAVDAVARVPLVIRPPGGMTLPKRVDRWTSLCEIPGWFKAAAKGLPPFGENGRAPAPFAPNLPDGGVVYCEGNPAGDMNRSLRTIGKDRNWNHRLLAAYRGDEKYMLDMDTGAIVHWALRTDPDWTPPEIVAEGDRASVRTRIFGPYENLAHTIAEAPLPTVHEVLMDRRMRSWGYD